jgi:hypothetical protein
MKQKMSRVLVSLTTLWLILANSLGIALANAQAAATLAVNPDQVNLPLGDQLVLELTVTNGVAVNGFDLRLTYNQDRLVLRDWDHGGYIESPSCVTENKSPGLLELECTQAGQQSVSGDGLLLTLTFDTLALGTSDITLQEAVFVNDQGLQSQPNRVNGEVNIQNLPTWTPAFTLTPTVTLTQPAAATQTATQRPPTATSLAMTETPTATSSPSPSPVPMQNTGTPEGPPASEAPTKTLTTPISGVAGPSQRTGTGTATVFTLTPTEDMAAETPEDLDGMDGDPQGDLADPQKKPGMGLWSRLVLGAGVFFVAVLVALIVLWIRRRKQENEDLLL